MICILATIVALPTVCASLPPDSCVHARLGGRRAVVGPADASRESVTEPPDAATIPREILEATVIDGSDAVKHFNLERHSPEAALSAPPDLTASVGSTSPCGARRTMWGVEREYNRGCVSTSAPTLLLLLLAACGSGLLLLRILAAGGGLLCKWAQRFGATSGGGLLGMCAPRSGAALGQRASKAVRPRLSKSRGLVAFLLLLCFLPVARAGSGEAGSGEAGSGEAGFVVLSSVPYTGSDECRWGLCPDFQTEYGVSLSPGVECELVMKDSYGDGWDGASWSGLGQEGLAVADGYEERKSFVDVSFTGCEASESGGGMNVYRSGDVTLEGASFSECTAVKDGGGMFVYSSVGVSLDGASFSECTSGRDGGGMSVWNSGDVSLEGSSVVGCTSGSRAALYLTAVDRLALTNSQFVDNIASQTPAALFFTSRIAATDSILRNTTFFGNSAPGNITILAASPLTWDCPLGSWMPNVGQIDGDLSGCNRLCAEVFCDDSSGQPKETLDKYRFTGHDGLSDSLCKAFLAGKFVGVDYINGANGVLDWMGASLHAQRLPRIHVKDLYVIPSKMRRFGAFLNLLFVGIG
ncbi:hypothetical protein EMIHUDRAFT_198648 [Emiliania huxleyi CCMP1516]|uniref:Right handed beta helix domain-containing protein n=2 Tax=Emiliania huxleyi TaxID=2903 RepID=A0A0D3I7M8_EMIH1|nr:hypothetical protein EMIHUDRAFT_198648 [Emiliania huxleyi CCMP1516]EOD07263.1 hypothetical protein EMIHUDRAFT_198648 [Emiliania huxleyi CCMP1516]|eukprot:XP_005759692.1 hypothetical protein EMIHUDRAFT_198648 [Emiliania huxleyi CCMP1516]